MNTFEHWVGGGVTMYTTHSTHLGRRQQWCWDPRRLLCDSSSSCVYSICMMHRRFSCFDLIITSRPSYNSLSEFMHLQLLIMWSLFTQHEHKQSRFNIEIRTSMLFLSPGWVLCHLLALALNKTNVQFQISHGLLYTMKIQIISGSLGHSFSALCAQGGWLVMNSPSKQHWCHPFYLCSIHFLLSPAPAWWWCWLGPDLHLATATREIGSLPLVGRQLAPAPRCRVTSPVPPDVDLVTAEFLGTVRRLLFHEVSTTPEITKMFMGRNVRDERRETALMMEQFYFF